MAGKGEFDPTNRGVLFANDKDGNEARPDYTGNINVEGKEFRLAAWVRQSEKAGEYLSIAISEPKKKDAKKGSKE